MKIFVAGAKSVKIINEDVKKRLFSISEKCYDVLIGDCYGIDTAVQDYFISLQYPKVTIYASNGIARNNLGNWPIHSVPVAEGIKGFDFYRQKDIAMAAAADYGFMIWDGKSKGTLNNIISLVNQNKTVVIYLVHIGKTITVRTKKELSALISTCDNSTQKLFKKYAAIPDNCENTQLSLFE